jgi:NADPH2:quinone reductase
MTATSTKTQPESENLLAVPRMMRAMVYERYGDPSCLQLAEIKAPWRLPGSVVIRVHAAGVNPIDARMRRGEAKWLLPGGFPRVPGYDVAGQVVDAAGDTGPQVGDRVLAFLDKLRGGGYAEYAKCSVAVVAKIPDAMSYEEAAALPLAGSTALQGLRDKGRIKQGNRVLINGASGGVGAFAVQIAKAYGANVTGVASGEHRDYVLELGADDYIDYQQEDFAQFERKWDLVLDAAGKRSFRNVRPVLQRGGHYVTTEPSVRALAATLLTTFASRRSSTMLVRPKGDDLAELIRLYQSDQLRVTLADVVPLELAAEAHRRLEAGGHCGKYVLRVSDL